MNREEQEDRFSWQSPDDVTITPPSSTVLGGFTLLASESDSDDTTDEDDDVEPDDSVDLDTEIEELEKLIAQKRYQARPFTIRRVPIHSKG